MTKRKAPPARDTRVPEPIVTQQDLGEARLEGDRCQIPAPPEQLPEEPIAADERRPQDYAAALDEAIAFYRERDPEGWDELALCPLQHGVPTIVHKLRAFR